MSGTELRVPVRAGELAATLDGKGDRVLALHGGPGLAVDYLDGMVAELRAHYEVATYQQRGLAPSTTSGPFSVAQEVDDACRVLDALGWSDAWVVGHSWGGHLLLHLAVAQPGRVRGGLVVEPLGAVGDGGAGAMGAELEARVAALAGQTERVDAAHEATGLGRVWPGYFAVPHEAPPMPPIRSSKLASEGIWPTIISGMPLLARSLRTCEVPMLFLAGAHSPLPPEEASGATAALLPHAAFETVEGAGHFPWVERPGSVRDALDRLVARQLD